MSAAIEPGASLGVYQIEAVIGHGPVAAVFRARQQALDRPVALKILDDDAARDHERLQRFQREAIIAASLRHPHIVTVFDSGSVDGRHFMVMELLSGVPVSELTLPLQPLPAIRIITQVLKALVYAHGEGVVHQNLKPENVLIDRSGHVTLTDFGAERTPGEVNQTTEAAPDGAIQTTEAAPVDAVDFRSPEQARGDRGDARSDVYSVGLLLWYLLRRDMPYHAGSIIGAMRRQTHEPLPLQYNQSLPAIRYWVQRCTAEDPEERFNSAAEALQSLRKVAAELSANTGREPAGLSRPSGGGDLAAGRTPDTVSSSHRTLVRSGPPPAAPSLVPASAVPGGVTIWEAPAPPAWWLIPAWSGLMGVAMWAVIAMAMTTMRSPLILLPWILALAMAFSASRRRAPFRALAMILSELGLLFALGLTIAGGAHETFWGYSLVAITGAAVWTGICSGAVSLSRWRRERKRRYVVLERADPGSAALPAVARGALLDIMAPTARHIRMGERQLGLRVLPSAQGARLTLHVDAFDRLTGATIARAQIEGDIADSVGLAGDVARQLRADLLSRALPAPR